MTPRAFLQLAIDPGLALLPAPMASDEARVLLMAIAGQESNLAVRAQVNGPALGYWQFEIAGVMSVLDAEASLAQLALDALDIDASVAYSAIEFNDSIACVFARLLLWSDPVALPAIGDESGAWDYYVRNWRPGEPNAMRWSAAYTAAVGAVAAVKSA